MEVDEGGNAGGASESDSDSLDSASAGEDAVAEWLDTLLEWSDDANAFALRGNSRGRRHNAKSQIQVMEFVYRHRPRCARDRGGRSLRSIYKLLAQGPGPVQCTYSTLYRWFRHCETFHELPFQTEAAVKALRAHPAYRVAKRQKIVTSAVAELLRELCKRDPTMYLDEYVHELAVAGHGLFTLQQVSKALLDLRLTRKLVDARSDTQDEVDRAAFRAAVRAVQDPAMLLFMDEKSKNRYSARRRWGRAVVGERARVIERFTRSDRHAYSFVAAADIDGYVGPACKLYWRPRPKGCARVGEEFTYTNVTSEVFLWQLEFLVAPHMGNFALGEPRSVLILDNASWHNKVKVQEIVEARGAVVIWTPVCSPDYNPIEFTFATYARSLRRNKVSVHGTPEEVQARVYNAHLDAMDTVQRKHMIGTYKHVGFISNVPDV
jgi:hypothetical protein